MAIDINEWIRKIPGIEREQIIDWVKEISSKGHTTKEVEKYVMEKYFITVTKDAAKKNRAIKQFKKKWLIDPITGEPVEVEKEEPKSDPEKMDFYEEYKNDLEKVGPAVSDENEEETAESEESSKQDEVDDSDQEIKVEDTQLEEDRKVVKEAIEVLDKLNSEQLEDVREELEETEEIADDMKVDLLDVPEAEEPELSDNIPFDNPNLNIDIGDEEDDLDDIPDLPVSPMADMLKKRRPVLPFKRKSDFVTETVSMEQYQEVIKPFRTSINTLKEDGQVLIQYSQTIDLDNHPPYAIMRPYILNHKIKDINSRKILLNIENPAMPGSIIPQHVELGSAIDEARKVWDRRFFQATIDNFVTICEEFEKYISELIALIYILEIYCESNQRGKSMMEMTIPKEELSRTIMTSFENLKEIIEGQVVNSLHEMGEELKGEMVDVSGIIEKNMSRFDGQIRTAIDRVVWKVKTDVESTNLEDIKRSRLFMQNKRRSAYYLGAGPLAVVSILVDDLDSRVISENFKMDKITKYRRYSISEIQKKLGYKTNNTVLSAVKVLNKSKIVTIYKDWTFSLSK